MNNHCVVPQLKWIYVYLTKACNCKCDHCWLAAEPGDLDMEVTTDDILGVANEAIALGLNVVRLTGGEPLIVPGIDELLRGLVALDVRPEIETNAMAVTSKLADTFADTNTWVGVSLDGEPDYHDAVRGVQGGYKRTLSGIGLMRDRGIGMMIVMSLRRGNVDQIQHVLDVAADNGIGRIKINPVLPVGRGEQLNDLLSVQELYDLNRRYINHTRPRVQFDLPPAFWPLSAVDRSPVCQFKSTLSVLASGTLAMCGLGFERDDWRLGSVESDLGEIWRHHPLLEHLRRDIPSRLKGICSRCLLAERCNGGCRAFALVQGGSWLAPMDYCEELNEKGLFPETRLIAE